MHSLRPYQVRAISMLRERYRDRPLLCIPTGGGKTDVASAVIKSAVSKGHRCIFLVHRAELVRQAVKRLARYGIQAGRIQAQHYEDRARPVQVASIPTLLKREHWPAQLVIVDECSHAVSESWSALLARYTDSWIIGLTATPLRLDGQGLGDLFGCIIEPTTIEQLIQEGYLVRPEVYAPPVDLRGIKVKMGEYHLPDVAGRMQKLVGSLTQTWMQHAQGLRTLAFAVNVEHSQKIVDAFRAIGVRAEHVDGAMGYQRREKVLDKLETGEVQFVSNCMVLTEGYDLPALQCVVLARPTKSLALFRQMVGRVVRPPGPALVLDHAGCHLEHGLVTDEIQWSLESPVKRTIGPDSLKTCKQCFAVFAPGPEFCPACGAPIPVRDEQDPPQVENPGELVKLDMVPRRRATEQEKQIEYRNLLRVASDRNYKLGWCRMRYRDTFGTWPRLKALEKAEYRCSGHEWKPKSFGPINVQRCERCYAEAGRA